MKPLNTEQQELVTKWASLPAWTVNRYFKYVSRRDKEDLIDAATDALFRAAVAYDPERGAKFAFFAVGCCRRAAYTAWRRVTTSQQGREFESFEKDDDTKGGPGNLLQVPSRESEPWEDLATSETVAAVRAAINRLPDHLREAVELRELEGKPTLDLRRDLHCGMQVLQQRLRLAKHLLWKDLSQTDADGNI